MYTTYAHEFIAYVLGHQCLKKVKHSTVNNEPLVMQDDNYACNKKALSCVTAVHSKIYCTMYNL